jgi:hypothetical protein
MAGNPLEAILISYLNTDLMMDERDALIECIIRRTMQGKA